MGLLLSNDVDDEVNSLRIGAVPEEKERSPLHQGAVGSLARSSRQPIAALTDEWEGGQAGGKGAETKSKKNRAGSHALHEIRRGPQEGALIKASVLTVFRSLPTVAFSLLPQPASLLG